MAKIIKIKTHVDKKGLLTVIENEIIFDTSKISFLYGIESSLLVGSKYQKSKLAIICIKGNCLIINYNNGEKEDFFLNEPDQCLLLTTNDEYVLSGFSKDAILLILDTNDYDPDDYFYFEQL